ncbi:hypothetical protein BKI52_45205 [marine bacterium AO1-C]|nr:hypothetical protein BKI52_45205 [marine bacterium AO1-C]
MSQEQFITHKPINPTLAPYISYYYFHSAEDCHLQKRFTYYPGFKNALTIYKHATVKFAPHYSQVVPGSTSNYVFIYSGMQPHPRTADMVAPFDKIGIVFNGLGINHFILSPLDKISPHPIEKSFHHFGNEFTACCRAVYAEDDITTKVALLDHFFTSQLIGFQNYTLLKGIETIHQSTQKLSVSDLAEQLNIHRKTLLRLFQKHLVCSVKDYLDIVQFRKSLDDYFLFTQQKISLTELALKNDYYDQSQFIHHFQRLAGINPKTFFHSVQQVGQEATFWALQ